jgi:DNA-binding response OmpR family regulator
VAYNARMAHVAVVDDDDLVRGYLSDLLTDRGYALSVFDRAGAAYDALGEAPPDLLLCDVELPDGSGLDLVARLRAVHGEALPVLMLSGLACESDIVRGYAAGATDYLTKPVMAAQLLAKIGVLLSRAGRTTALVPGGDALPGGAKAAFGRYRIEGVLGQGSYGIVFRAHDLNAKRAVALKVLGALTSSQPETRMRFLRETYALASVKDPHIVPVHDFGSAEGRLYYSMDLVPGPSLEARVRERPATEDEAIGLLRGLAQGLAAMEAVDIVHRDVKPANVILRDGDWSNPVLVDFGLAKHPFDRGLTDAEMIVGTPAYMAPEMVLGHPVDRRSDLFSLGLLVRHAVSGEEVFSHLGGLQLLKAIASQQVDVPAKGLSRTLRTILRLLLQLDPARRPASASALLRLLDAKG